MQVGQTVWVTGGYRNAGATADVISRIGNKYFYLTGLDDRYKFDLKTLREFGETNYPHIVYLSLEDYQDKVDTDTLSSKIRSFFSGYGRINLSLDKLRAIDKIISEKEDLQ